MPSSRCVLVAFCCVLLVLWLLVHVADLATIWALVGKVRLAGYPR